MLRSINLRNIPSSGAVLLLSLVMIVATLIATTTVVLDLRQRDLTRAKGEIISLSRILADQTTRTFDGVALSMHSARDRLSDNFGREYKK